MGNLKIKFGGFDYERNLLGNSLINLMIIFLIIFAIGVKNIIEMDLLMELI